MKSYISKQVERFLREQKNYKRWLAVFLCLAVIVTIGTAGALKYKGIAVTADNEEVEVHLEEASVSEDMEASSAHVHTEDCYEEKEVLICDAAKEEQGHVHDDSCYSVSGGTEELTCDREEHSHDDSCYTTETVTETVSHTETDEEGNETTVEETVEHEETKLTCDREEHSHGGDCYSVSGGERTLICGLEEGEGAAASDHVHDDSCYEIQKVLVCGLEEGEEAPVEELVVPEEFKEGTLTAKGDDYEVIVSYGAEAEIPENAELKVEEIEQESDNYKEYYKQMVEALSANEDGQEMEITFARLFDIVILVDGEEIEPKTEVAVQINYDDVITEDEEQTGYAVHFPDNGEIEIMDADVRGGKEFGFSQSSFSPSGTVFAVPRDGEVDTARVVEVILEKGKYDYPAVSLQPGETIKLCFYTNDNGDKNEVKNLLASGYAECISVENDGKGKLQVAAANNEFILGANTSIDIEVIDPEEYGKVIYKVPIKIQDAANKYEVVYEGFEFETVELEEIEYGNTLNLENHFVKEQISDGSITEVGDSEAGISFPYTTWPLEYKLAKDKASGDYRYFALKGWRTKNGEVIESGTISAQMAESYSELKEGVDGTKVIKLTPVWDEVRQLDQSKPSSNMPKLPEVRFFIALNSEIQETDETQEVPSTASFTTAVAETTTNAIYQQADINDQGIKYVPIVYKDIRDNQRRVLVAESGEKLEVTAGIDTQIRSLATTGVKVTKDGRTWTYRLASFPTDEEVLREIRKGAAADGTISVGGTSVKKEDITADNFAVRWCVFKHDTSDQWHVDGVLVRKQGKLAVTKTFYGDKEAISKVNGKFNITVTDTQGNMAYTLKLHEKQENDSSDNWGYTEEIKNGSEVTYVWEIGVTASKKFTVSENNYEMDNSEIATVAEYRISNTKKNSTGTQTEEGRWSNYTGQGIEVTAESYASDLSYESFQTVSFKNGYLPKNSITVWKYDSASNKGLAGVVFELKKGEAVQKVWKNGSDYYLYDPNKEEFAEVEEGLLAVDASGLLVIHGLEQETTYGTYTLTEKTYPTGYAKKTVIFTIKEGSVELGSSASDGVSFTPVEGKNAYKLNISNESETMRIKAVKDWGTTDAEHIKAVKVELWRDGEKLEDAIELNEKNGWNNTFKNPYPVYVNGGKGNYTLRETVIGETYRDPSADADDGYQFYDVEVDPIKYSEEEKTGTITVHNTVDGRKLEVTKTDESGKGLPGAKFTLYSDPECSSAVKEAVSTSSGRVIFIGLSEETYYMKETEAPTGYAGADQIYRVTFDGKEGKIELYSSGTENGTPEESGDGKQAESRAITTIPNKVATQTIDIVKTDADGGVRLQGATFELTVNSLIVSGSYTPAGESHVSDKNGVVVSGLELPYGTYTLTETLAPENYSIVAPVTLTVSADGVMATGTAGDFEILEPSDGSVSYTIMVKDRLGMLDGMRLTKIGDQNSETRLNGAEFILGRDSDDGSREYAVIENGVVRNWVGDENGATHIETEKIGEEDGIGILPTLPVGEYYLKEVTPPKDYVLMASDVKFEIGIEGGTLRVAIRDGGAEIDKNNERNIFISNSMGIELPEAGGPGTVAYTFGGLAVIAVGLMYGLSMRRKREKGGLN